ncbi:MAG: thioredoxin domain-containing protein [bacterium]|nr:thioredoxin domain-containing protein [bacterium]
MKKSTLIIAGTVVLGVALLVWGSVQTSSGTNTTDPDVAKDILVIREDDWVRGATSTSELALYEYSDFQCPACRAYEPILAEIMTEFGSRISLVYRHFPLKSIHFNANQAAMASEAAGLQGKFFEMHGLLFSEQSVWSSLSSEEMKAKVLEFATTLDLDVVKFESDLSSSQIAEVVSADLADGQSLGVNSTPSFFLGGKKLSNPQSLEEFRLVLLEALGDLTIESEAVSTSTSGVEIVK